MSFYKLEDKDTCNLCRTSNVKLTEDHVPPYAVQRWKKLYILKRPAESILYLREKPPGYISQSQNGLSFYTLCEKCNNEVLGQPYDYALLALWQQIKPYAELKNRDYALDKQGTKIFYCKLGSVLRSVLGHGLATHLISLKSDFHNQIRDFIFDPLMHLPEEVVIYYWFYPGTAYKIHNGFSFCFDSNFKQFSYVDVYLKFWPLAFWVCKDQLDGLEQQQGVFRITNNLNTQANVEEQFQLDFSANIHPHWPEGGFNQDVSGLMLLNSELGVHILATTALKAKSLARQIKQSRRD